MSKEIRVEVKKDHLDKVASGRPVPSLAELIWNSLDADSSNVDVIFHDGELGVDQILIKDDGHGIKYSDAEEQKRRTV